MKLSIRWKLFASFLLLTVTTAGVLLLYLSPTLERHLVSDLSDHLYSQAGIASLSAVYSAERFAKDAPALAVEIGRKSDARVTIIAPDGTVVGDSEVPENKLADLENHKDRPEIVQALAKGRGTSIRYSTTLRSEMLYVAAPIKVNAHETGTIRLALPLTSLERLKQSLHSTIGMALLVAVVVSLVLSSLLSQLVYRPLRQLSDLAESFGSGDLSQRMAIRGNDEFGSLANVMNNMAERLQEQIQELAGEHNRLNAILRGMGEGVIVADRYGAITLVNPAFCTLFDVREEIVGRPLITISRHPSLHDSLRKTLEERVEHFEEITVTLNSERTLLTHWVPLLSENGLQGVVAVFHDITEIKRLETVRREFVANVSHELRTPVTVIRGYAETLLIGSMTDNPEQAKKFLSVILNHSERLSALISDLLSLSEMESGQITLNITPTPLAALIRHLASSLEMKTEEKGITITLDALDDSLAVMADRMRIEQVFMNLLDNAIKYTPNGGTVSIKQEVNGDSVITTITDTGPGIPMQSLPRIFERFYRVDPSRSREQGGTGLGLAIVKHIVLMHGGTVSVDSPPGKGASFSVSLKRSS